jgi:hypothetical protein
MLSGTIYARSGANVTLTLTSPVSGFVHVAACPAGTSPPTEHKGEHYLFYYTQVVAEIFSAELELTGGRGEEQYTYANTKWNVTFDITKGAFPRRGGTFTYKSLDPGEYEVYVLILDDSSHIVAYKRFHLALETTLVGMVFFTAAYWWTFPILLSVIAVAVKKRFHIIRALERSKSKLMGKVEAESIPYGSSVAISGYVTPIHSGEKVTISYRKDGKEWKVAGEAVTGRSGRYTFKWDPPEAGAYEVRVRWEGDRDHEGTENLRSIVVSRAPGRISVGCIPTMAVVGEPVEIHGHLDPSYGGAEIVLRYSRDGETWYEIGKVETSPEGRYGLEWSPPESGKYIIQASWSGDKNFEGAAGTCELTVLEKTESQISLSFLRSVRQVAIVSLRGVPRASLYLVDQYLSLLVIVTLVAAVIGAAYSRMVAAFTLGLVSCALSLLQTRIEERMGHQHRSRRLQRYFTHCRQVPSTPFVIAFMVFLLSAVLTLNLDLKEASLIAESLARNAYYLLVVGVGIQLLGYWKPAGSEIN